MKNYKGAKITTVVFALIIMALVINIVFLGVTGKHLVSGEDIATFAKNRSKKEVIQYAQRGDIYTSDDEKVAVNVKKYKIALILSSSREGYGGKIAYVKDIEKTASKLGPILDIDVSELTAKLQKAKDEGRYQIELGSKGNNLSANIKKKIEDCNLTGIEFTESDARYYPYGDFCSYLVGYAKGYEDKSVKKMVGEMGLELAYDKTLKGKNGYKVYQADANGYALVDGVLREKDPVNGQDLYLTINSSLQRNLDYMMANAYQESKAEIVSCGVMEVKTGRILAMSTYPSFNPNDRDMSSFNNYFLEGTLECGSVFKPFIYADSIEEGKYDGNAYYQSGKYNVYYGNKLVATIKDHNRGEGWGSITYNEGLYRSSNVAICNLLDNGFVTKDILTTKLDELGFYKGDTMDGLTCSSSINAYTKDTANRLEYLTTGFGQGSTVTPYQLLKAYSVFGNNGKTVKPYVVEKIVDKETNKVTYQAAPQYSKQIFSENTVNQVKDLMLGVIEESCGTGKNYRLDNGVKMIGKTGTGQVVENGAYSTSVYMHSFVGLAPYDDPQVVMFLTFKSGDSYAEFMPNIVKKTMTEALQVVNQYTVKEDTKDESYTLDSYINQSTNYIKSKLESKSLNVQLIGNGSSVIEQYPLANSKVTKGDKIFIKTEGKEITLPDLTNWSKKEVQTFASLAKIQLTIEGSSGHVTKQSIEANQVIHENDRLTVTIEA